MGRWRVWFAGLFILTVIAYFTVAARSAEPPPAAERNPAATAAPRLDANWFRRHESFVRRTVQGPVDVLFLGDSITQGWEGAGKDVWKERFAPLKAANFGIGGDQTQHVLWRITTGTELQGIEPKVAVLMIGTNNLGGHSVEQIAGGITAIVKELRKQKPGVKVLLLGIFPRSEKPDAPQRDKIKKINEIISKLDDGSHVKYLDIGEKFLEPDGTLSRAIMPDFLHLSAKGYTIWADAVEPAVKELLK
jgi:lysophospholipase L1-like esterase